MITAALFAAFVPRAAAAYAEETALRTGFVSPLLGSGFLAASDLPLDTRRAAATRRLYSYANAWGDTTGAVLTGVSGETRLSGLALVANGFAISGAEALPPPRRFGPVGADFDEAYVALDEGAVRFWFGRRRFALGPPVEFPPAMSGYGVPRDGFGAFIGNRRLALSTGFSTLQRGILSLSFDSTGRATATHSNRYFNYHRLTALPVETVSLSFTEGVTYAGEGRAPEAAYFNPLLVYYFWSWDYGRRQLVDDNYFWDFDVRWRFGSLLLSAEAYVDDLQYARDRFDEPSEFALAFGATWARGNALYALEYTLATRWVYNARDTLTRPVDWGLPLGNPAGDDFDRAVASALLHAAGFDLSARLTLLRDGEGNPFEPWPPAQFPKPLFLVGTVERSVDARAGITAYPSEAVSLSLSVGVAYYANFRHAAGDDRLLPVIEAGVTASR